MGVNRGRTVDTTAVTVMTAGTCLFFLAFAVARAFRVAFTYDEAATYARYISSDVLSVFNFDAATNHFLNTLLTKVSYLAGGDSELVLRIPNLIGYGMYLVFSLRILRGLTHRLIAFAALMLLNLNPYVLDYFSLSRGYGLSLGFLMGALFFLFRFLSQLHSDAAARRELSRTLVLACGAVLANFTLLNVYLGVFLVALVALAVRNVAAGASAAPGADGHETLPGRGFPWLPVVAAVFTLLVLSQDIGLSEKLYEPVAVRFVGLNEAELEAVEVGRIDVRGRLSPLSRHADVWRTDRRVHFTGVRIEVPVAATKTPAVIEVIVGNRLLAFWPDRPNDAWISRDEGTTRVLESTTALSLSASRMPAYRSIMNWGGDARYVACLAGYTTLALCVLGVLAVVLKAVGALAVRARLLSDHQWRPLASGALWLAALIGSPLYLLNRESALYYGGTEGLIQDTFYSVIESSFYGKTYHPSQADIVFGSIAVTLAAFTVVLYVSYRRTKLRPVLPGIALLAIMALASVAAVAQHFMFQTPYPLGRTALFYIPLYVLFLTFLLETIAELGPAGATFAVSFVMVVLSLSLSHFLATANVKYTRDWQRDASTKTMMEDLAQVIAADRPAGSRVVLGVDWMYSASAAFYARKVTATAIDVVVVPSPSDFLYVDDGPHEEARHVIRRYPVAGAVLARVGTTR